MNPHGIATVMSQTNGVRTLFVSYMNKWFNHLKERVHTLLSHALIIHRY